MKKNSSFALLVLFLSSLTFAAPSTAPSDFKTLLIQFSELSQKLHQAPAHIAAEIEDFSKIQNSPEFLTCKFLHFKACKSLEKKRADLSTAISSYDSSENFDLIILTQKLISADVPAGVNADDLTTIITGVVFYFQFQDLNFASFDADAVLEMNHENCSDRFLKSARIKCGALATEKSAATYATELQKSEINWDLQMESLNSLIRRSP